MDTPQEEKSPYISMNKLAEFMQADPLRRKRIVEILMQDSDFISNWYHRVYKIFPEYFESGYDESVIDGLISEIAETPDDTDWRRSDNANSIQALELLKAADLPDLSEYEIAKDLVPMKHIMISGVKVTLKPDIYLRNIQTEKVGAIKVHIQKTPGNRLEEEGRQYAATLLKIGFIEHGIDEKDVDNNACISLDLFAQEYDAAPGAYKRKRNQLEASCEEISLRWMSE